MSQYNNDELQHWGVKGMKWGVRRFHPVQSMRNKKAKRIQDREENRKISERESQEQLKKKVESNRREAANRIKFYGGKNTALNAIKQESKYRQGENTRESIEKAIISGVGTSVAGFAIALAANTIVPFAGSTIVGAGLAAGNVALGQIKNKKVREHAEEQVSYTKDSEYGHDMVVRNVKE